MIETLRRIVRNSASRPPWNDERENAESLSASTYRILRNKVSLSLRSRNAGRTLGIAFCILSWLTIVPQLNAQTTTVTLQVTDTSSQTWNNGSYSAVLTPPPGAGPVQFLLSGVVMTPGQITVSGNLNATGGATFSLSQNAAITPPNTFWTIQVCPQATASCFKSPASISGATQNVTITPPPIIVTLANPPYTATAYADSEVTGVVVGSQYYNLTSQATRVCTVVSGSACTNWVASAGAGGLSFVSSLPGTCTPGTTPDVEGNTAVAGYPVGAQFYCSATNTWSARVANQSATGTFTSAAMNQLDLVTLNGGGTCNTNTITNLGGSTFNLTDAFATCVNIPTSGVTNGFTNGFATYMINPNANSTGQFGWVGDVGYYSQVWCRGGSAANTRCWGANFSVSDDTALPATLFGNEYDITVNNNTTSGAGNIYSFRGNGQPTSDTFPAITLQKGTGTGRFTSGFRCESGATSSGASNPNACVNMGQAATGVSQDSQAIWFNASSASTALSLSMHLLQDNFAILGSTAGNPTQIVLDADSPNGTVGSVSGFGITLKATASLTVNALVKIDTANTDSVVICTTADTSCDAFVAGGATYCAAGGTHCGLISAPGMKAIGILGTGTCSIGNFVVVDTTTNGRIKCQATIPAQGAYIGKALSAQVTVGSAVDILTKFQ